MMTPKEYLSQGYRLENYIKLQIREIEKLKEMAVSLSSPGLEEHYNPNRNTDAPYIKALEKIDELEKEHSDRLTELLDFKNEITEVISQIDDKDLRLVLHYRYICNWNWKRIGDELGWDEKTIRRWHDKALLKVRVPDNATVIGPLQHTPKRWG